MKLSSWIKPLLALLAPLPVFRFSKDTSLKLVLQITRTHTHVPTWPVIHVKTPRMTLEGFFFVSTNKLYLTESADSL